MAEVSSLLGENGSGVGRIEVYSTFVMRGDVMMLTDSQQRDFLNKLFDWLRQRPRSVKPGAYFRLGNSSSMEPYPRPDDYAFTLYAEGTRDHWRLRCHFNHLPDNFRGYHGDFCVNLLKTPEVFDWIDSEYLLQTAKVGGQPLRPKGRSLKEPHVD